MSYSEKLLKRFYCLQHAGWLEGEAIVKSCLGSEKQGELLELYIQLDGDRIKQAYFQAYGSVALLAGADYVCEWLIGKRLSEISQLKPEAVLSILGLPDFKIHTARLLCKAAQGVSYAAKHHSG